MLESLIYSDLISKIVKTTIKSLSKRHAVNIKYLLNDEVEIQFAKCINIATNAFLERIKKYKNFEQEDIEFFIDYLKNNQVSEEISRLLDPGFEVFDIDFLVSEFEKTASEKGFTNYSPRNIKIAWNEFLRAFSFASRSAPDLREFLRASYEAGSFRALSNVNDVIKKIGDTLEAVNVEENRLRHLIHAHSVDLHQYRDWADRFLM
jgi:hypothetical protein